MNNNEMIVSFEIYETIGVGRGPVGLEPLFRAIDEQNKQDLIDKYLYEIQDLARRRRREQTRG